MRSWIWIALTAACGPMSQTPSAPPPNAPPGDPVAGDPAASSDVAGAPGHAAELFATVASDDAGPEVLTPAEPARAGGTAPRDEAAQWVEAHNRVRAKHCAAPLTWSAKLAEIAQRWANALRDRGCQFGHSGGTTGENLAAGTIGTLDPGTVVQMWYDEVAQYHFPDGGFSSNTGHFTQVVWRGTRRVGCGHSQCKGLDILVCEYDPAGNWEGQYRDNVLPRGCKTR
jgi:uncharacterized protein YkwD